MSKQQQNKPLPEVSTDEVNAIHEEVETVYRTGHNIGKLHITEDCVWLSDINADSVIEKSIDVYPPGWADFCKWCVEYQWRKE